jgi:hypothetical protein
VEKDISDSDLEIRSLKKKENRARKLKAKQNRYRKKLLEEKFSRDNDGKTTLSVRNDYIKLLEEHSYQGGKGYRVSVPGYNKKGVHHFVLREEFRDLCTPTPVVEIAFGILGETVKIADLPHVEKWGN